MVVSKFTYEVVVTDTINPYSSPIALFNLTSVNDPSFQISEQREKGKMYFVKKIKNKLIVTGSDYAIFRGYIGNCYKYWINIYKKCGATKTFIAQAFFSEKYMEFDLDKCHVEIELQDKSPYQCFKDKKSEKFDVYGQAQTPDTFLEFSPTLFRTMSWGVAVLQVTSFMSCCDESGCYYNLTSDFFNWLDDGFGGTILPDDQAMTNYVNITQPNYYLRLAAKSDIKNPNASNPATKLLLSFDDIERIMEDVFNVYWVLQGTRLRFEHYSWFTNTMNYDAISVTNFPLNLLRNQIKFNTEELPETESFELMEANGVDFVGVPIEYNPDCANGKKIKRGFESLTTDTDYIINNSSSIDNNGFVLIDCYKINPTPEWYVYSAVGQLSTASVHNVRLSWANLHYDLFRHGRPFITGTMNNISQTFLSKEPDVIQENILTELCCVDTYEKWESSVKTEIGNGKIDEAEIDYTKEIIKFKLRHSIIPPNL